MVSRHLVVAALLASADALPLPTRALPTGTRLFLLDRDGCINRDVGAPGVVDVANLSLIPGSAGAVRRLRLSGPVAIVTNQSCRGKGLLSAEQLDEIHSQLRHLLAKTARGGRVGYEQWDALYICEDASSSPRKKPEPGMLLEACADFGCEPAEAVMIGDSWSDMVAARRAGCVGVLVLTGHGESLAAQLKQEGIDLPTTLSARSMSASPVLTEWASTRLPQETELINEALHAGHKVHVFRDLSQAVDELIRGSSSASTSEATQVTSTVTTSRVRSTQQPRMSLSHRAAPPSLRSRGVSLNAAAQTSSSSSRIYSLAGGATVLSWSACAAFALGTYKPHRIVHNLIGILQALTVVPMIWSAFTALGNARAADGDGRGTASEFARQLLLALAVSSVWSVTCVVFAPYFSSAVVRASSDPVRYPLCIAATASVAHLATAWLCLDGWKRRVASSNGDPRFMRTLVLRVLDSLWRLGPSSTSIPPARVDSTTGASSSRGSCSAVYRSLAVAFAVFTLGSIFAPFPIATLPSLLGKRLARAYGAWTWLATVCFVALKDAAERRTIEQRDEASYETTLRRGMSRFAYAHLFVSLIARPLLDKIDLYPAALACKPAVIASLLVFALAAWVGHDKHFLR